MQRIYYINFIFYCTQIVIIQAGAAEDFMHTLLGQYRRSITVLEVGRTSHAYLFGFAKRYPGTYVLMDRKLPVSADTLEDRAFKNIVFLHPEYIDAALLLDLGKCEHFDVAIIRDGDHLISEQMMRALPILLGLGDHIFIEMPERFVEAAQKVHACEVLPTQLGMCLCYFEMHKTSILKSRWTASEENSANYGIVSNFEEKRMAKQSTGTTSSWIPGINLLTFLMLRGVYPTDNMMRKQLKTFKHIDHNDLVIGNIVVQGAKITPIDFHDKRRNIDPAVCVKAALKKVIKDGRIKDDPYRLLHKYTVYLMAHKRGMQK